jgi:hypothetical protein
MKETEWLESTDPWPMLRFLHRRVSDRKLLLFACACCRRVWHQLTVDRSREAVAVLERYADGQVTFQELVWAANGAGRGSSRPGGMAVFRVALAVRRSNIDRGFEAASAAVRWIGAPTLRGKRRRGTIAHTANVAESAAQCMLLRDLFGNPFRAAPIAPEVFTWHEGAIPKLAQAIYDERAFNRLPSLGDALEGAGCTEDSILAHCREAGGHVRGCWAVDLLLSEEQQCRT